MSVAVDIGGPFPHMDTHNKRSEDSIIGDRSSPINLTRSRSPTPPPSCDSLSNLHRVTDMLKDKLNGPSQDHMTSRDAEPANRRSPYSGHVTSSGSGKPINGCGPNMENYAQHHMSVLLNNEVYNNESSNVLRGILQGKDRMMDSESQIRSHRYNNLYGDNKNGSVKDDSDAESFRSVSPGNLSLDDSDPDRRVNGVSDMDEIMDESKDARESFIDNENSNDSERELGEVKMNTFSGDKGSEDPVTPERRPKRKQYIPQQHGTLGEPSTKLRRIEREILQKQLKHMQQQLTVMHQRYCALFDQGEEISGLSDLSGPVLPEGAKMSASKSRSDEKPGIPLDFDPSHFIKQASKLVQEQEFVSKNPCQTSPLSGQTPLDIHNLANQLKDEITHGVGALVDTVVAKFVEDKVKHTSTTVHSPPPVEKPKKERVATPPPPPVEPEVRRKSPLPSNIHNNNNIMKDSSPHFHHKFPFKFPVSSHSFHPLQHLSDSMCAPRPPRTKVTDKIAQPFFDFHPAKPFAELARAHPALFPPPPYFPTQIPPIQPLYAKEPEQTEPMSLVLGSASQKKKRTKVTDTRLSPRAARALLQEGTHHSNPFDLPKHHPGDFGHPAPPLIPISLPTSVAIPNPSLQQSDILSMYSHEIAQFEQRERERVRHSPSASPSMSQLHDMHHSMKDLDFDQMESNYSYDGQHMITLTPMHLRKAKLMFFYTRYPSSSILKIYFPDVKFNKNNTAQLVKWFSNFREFFYIQMEKYARQALAEGVKNADDLIVTLDSELYRILNLHYNRNNQIEVPDAFRGVVQATLREFFKSIQAGKDSEQSWKKAIYKIIARLDDGVPEYFKSPNWMEQLNDG